MAYNIDMSRLRDAGTASFQLPPARRCDGLNKPTSFHPVYGGS